MRGDGVITMIVFRHHQRLAVFGQAVQRTGAHRSRRLTHRQQVRYRLDPIFGQGGAGYAFAVDAFHAGFPRLQEQDSDIQRVGDFHNAGGAAGLYIVMYITMRASFH